jgi:hypothetical protein
MRQFRLIRNLGASCRRAAGPGFPLVSFLPLAKKDTASIPCAETVPGTVFLDKNLSRNLVPGTSIF